MTDNKDNPPINLELLERQLREALARRPSDAVQSQAAQRVEDPLSELNRMTGYETAQRAQQSFAQPSATHQVPPPGLEISPMPVHPPAVEAAPDYSHSFERPQAPVTPQPASSRANIPLFQTISVNYGGFNSSSLAQAAPAHEFHPELAPQPAPVLPTPPVQPSPPVQPTLPPSPAPVFPSSPYTEGGSVSGFSSPLNRSDSILPGSITMPAGQSRAAEQVASPHAAQPDPYAQNPYSDFELGAKPAAQTAPQQPIFETQIFNLRPPVAAPMEIKDPAPAPSFTSAPAWQTAQSEPRPALSMSEAEAHDDLLNHAHQDSKSSSGGKGIYILLGLLVLLGGGFGLAAYLRNEGAVIPLGPAPVINADKTPVKIAPVDQGQSQNTQQSAAIYQPGKMDDPKDAKIVNNEEKPVDVNTVPRPAGAPLLGEPKKVRTVTIRPDGSVVEENATSAGTAAPNIAAAPRAGSTIAPLPASPTGNAPSVTTPIASANSAAQPQLAPAAAPPQGPTVKVLPPERPQSLSVAQNSPSNPPPAAAEPATASAQTAEKIEAGSGDYGVQFGAPASENEARSMITNLKKNKIFDGLSFVVQKADSSGRTIFRVRVIGLARDSAISLCEKLKSTGTQCFVAKN